jgi:ribosomal protein S19
LIGEKKRIVKKRIVVKKRFVAKHLLETFEKIKKGEEREIIVTWLRHLLFLSHTIMKLFFFSKY